ncbi:MAG: gliding motility-associated C-terminal domain-containing protein [Bacteroidota bacterium]
MNLNFFNNNYGVRIYMSVISFFLLIVNLLFGQYSSGNGWLNESKATKIFIENKGQFKLDSDNEEIFFRGGDEQSSVFFKKSALVYTFLKHWKDKDEINEKKENINLKSFEDYKKHELKEKKIEFESDIVSVKWLNANPNSIIRGIDKNSDYNSYSFIKDEKLINVNFVSGYRKIVYENLYPGIDAEYIFHSVNGIKYNLIIHPGADLSVVEMEYSREPKIKKDGSIHIKTKFGEIIEHAPVSFYSFGSGNQIKSNFYKEGNKIKFKLDNYDHSKIIIIDPWVQLPTFGTTTWNCVWECEKDGSGNVYALGGGMSQSANSQMQIKKYNVAGVLQWTYNTPYDTSNCWLGTFATDNAGNSYVTRGSVSGMQKINSAGTLVWNNNGGGGSIGNSDEYWNIAFNCDQTKLIVGGTSGAFGLPPVLEAAIFEIDVNSGSILSTQKVAKGPTTSIPPNTQEIRSLTSCPNGRYYYLTQDTIGYTNQNFLLCPSGSSGSFKINNGIDLGYKCEDYRFDNSGIMALRSDSAFLYLNRGNQIQKRSLQTLSVIANATIPGGGFNNVFLGGNTVSNSGIDVDQCGNIYVGSKNQVIKFNSNLSVLATYTTSFNVYDLHVLSSGDIVVCGSTGNSSTTGSRAGYVQVIAASACNPIAFTCCNTSICTPSSFCQNDPAINLLASSSGGVWSGPGITNSSSGTFNPTLAGVGTHTVTYTLPCGSESIQITVLGCQTLNVCAELNGDITVNGTGTYSWYQQTTSQNCSACIFGCNFPPGCSVSVTSWTNFATGTTINPGSGSYPMYVINNNGDSAYIPNFASLPQCNSCALSATISSQTNVSCNGGNDGSATVNLTGAFGAINYAWSPFGGNSSTANNLSSGTYTCIITSNSCTATTTVTITEPDSIVINTSSVNSSCGQSDGSASVSVIGGTGTYVYLWSPGGQNTSTINNLSPGTYTVVVTDQNSCSITQTVLVNSQNLPNVNAVATGPFCEGGSINLNASGGVNYSWSGPSGFTSSIQNPQIFPALINMSGTYSVLVTDASGCFATATVNVLVSATPQISITSSNLSNTVNSGESIVLTANGASSYVWYPGGISGQTLNVNTSAGGLTTYCTIGTSLEGCQDSSCVNINVIEIDCGTLYIPNAFSPNGDQANDELCIYGAQCIETMQLIIFDRWGEKIFETSNPQFCWDGVHKGKKLNPGVFAYILNATFKSGEQKELKGNVTLIK